MRVTNEQAKKIVEVLNDNWEVYNYAADLLDARELIDKQEALIKDMREVLSSNLRDMDKIDRVCSMAGVHPYTIMRAEVSAILEKSKDYA